MWTAQLYFVMDPRFRVGFSGEHPVLMAVQAPTSGTIATICTEEGEVVEFDQPVYEIYPEMASSGSRIK